MASTETGALGDPVRLELGYWLSSEEHSARDLVDHARAAEAVGIRTAMISDHFTPWVPEQSHSAFVWSVLGGIAATTNELRVGTGVSAAIYRMHPLVLAHAAATVETMMPGRFFLGLGTGERLNEQVMGQRWPPPEERRAMLREAIEVIRSLWCDDTVSHIGDHFRVERASLTTRPAVPPPIVIAGGGTRSAALAGEVGDGVIGVEPKPEIVDAFEAAGGAGKPRLAQVHVCWAESESAARATVQKWWPQGALPSRLLSEIAMPSEFAAAAHAMSDERVTANVTFGPDPAVHAASITRFVAAGFTTIYLHQIGPDQAGFLEFCDRELLPRFRTS